MGQQVSKTFWVSDDGNEFESEADMQAYEAETQVAGLVDLAMDDIAIDANTERGAAQNATRFKKAAALAFNWARSKGYLTPAAVEDSMQRQAQLEAEKAAAKEAARAARKAEKEAAAQAAGGASPFPGAQPAAAGMA